MKIYFAGSISAGREFANVQKELIDFLKTKGEVLTEHIGNTSLTTAGESLPDKVIHDRDLEWVLSADVIIAEVSTPSLGVGYEIGRAVENNKKVLCLYQPNDEKRLSGMIAGCDGVSCVAYFSSSQAKKAISEYLASIS